MRPNKLSQSALRVAMKSGFLTKSLWVDFFCQGKKRYQNRSWLELKRKNIFRDHPNKIVSNVLVPIKSLALVPTPFVNQIEHDEEVLRIILNMEKKAKLSKWKSEMELKQDYSGNIKYNKGSNFIKFPDAEIHFESSKTPISLALEVELNQKSRKRYKEIALAYTFHKNSDFVVFVCAEEAIEKSVLESFYSVRYPFNEKPIGIAKLSEWRIDPLNSELKINGVKTSLKILLESLQENNEKIAA